VVRSGTRRAFPSTDYRWAAGCGDLLARQMDARHICVWMRRHARALQRLRSSCQRIQPAPIRLCTVRHPKQSDEQLDTLTRCNGFGSGAAPLGIYHFPGTQQSFLFGMTNVFPSSIPGKLSAKPINPSAYCQRRLALPVLLAASSRRLHHTS
jgi:hypothetical protein